METTDQWSRVGFDDFHVVPVGDLREHTVSSGCWCRPTPDDEHPNIFIHHAMDQREAYETGKRLGDIIQKIPTCRRRKCA